MAKSSKSTPELPVPKEPIDRVVEPLTRFLHIQSASGIVLLLMAATALVLANSPFSAQFVEFWKTPLGFSVGDFELRHSLRHWINDGLMVIFFFVVGLEVKRELVLGELRDLRAATLPLAAALGGMVVPAAFYLTLQFGAPGEKGWGIPMATDIAFVVGCLAILGSHAPRSLRILLLTLAIADDIGAILVIAVGYTKEIHLPSLAGGVVGIGVVLLMQRLGVRSVLMYVAAGIGIWFGFHESGVHATIAGVVLGLLTPARPWVSDGKLAQFVHQVGDFFQGEAWPDEAERRHVLKTMRQAARESLSPVERLESRLHPWVSFGVMPLFALANAGVPLQLESLADRVTIAVLVGLFLGKPIGIFLFSWFAVRLGVARLPGGVTWPILAAGGVLAGIGFTMSLFIASLALDETLLDAAKIGILAASLLSALVGMGLLLALSRPPRSPTR